MTIGTVVGRKRKGKPMPKIPSLEDMLKAGVHFGHKTSRWHPKMAPYIFTNRNGVHVIDLEKTREKLKETLGAVKQLAADGKNILFVTTKPQAKAIVKQAAIDCGMPYLVDRWIGGLLTNFSEMKKMIQTFVSLSEKQQSGELEKYTKKEQSEIAKDLEKKRVSLSGLTTVTRMPDALFIPSFQREKTAVTEANRMGVPIIAVVDTNANQTKAAYCIPANDDALQSIIMMVGLVKEAIQEGLAERKPLEEPKETIRL
ncbi:MAG TPA: 30S ribosomal protein S2 [Candidatus Magasanikbacteria bacterium]|nr:30S ribosomal protein S2 [Candidatus Magasanikbacteria bacterium]